MPWLVPQHVHRAFQPSQLRLVQCLVVHGGARQLFGARILHALRRQTTNEQGKLGPESSCKPLSPAGCRRRLPRTSGRGAGRRGPGPAPPAAATSERCRESRTGTPPSRPAPTQPPPSETNEQADRQNTERFRSAASRGEPRAAPELPWPVAVRRWVAPRARRGYRRPVSL